MPEPPAMPKVRAHPAKAGQGVVPKRVRHKAEAPYAALQVTTNFSFLRGASHPEESVGRAAELGYRGIAVTDRNSLAGIVRAHVAAKQVGIPLAVGARLDLQGEPEPVSLLVYPTDRASYGRLCQLLTIGKRRAPKGGCHLELRDLIEHQQGLLAIVLPPPEVPPDLPLEVRHQHTLETLCELRGVFRGDRLAVGGVCRYDGLDRQRLQHTAELAAQIGVPMVATHDVAYHCPTRKPLMDVLTCIREHCTLDTAGFRLDANAERHLKPPDEMHRLFAHYPDAVARAVELIERASAFSLDELRYEYPHETSPPGSTPIQHLAELTRAGAIERYPNGVPAAVRDRIEHELRLIEELNYPHYFLTVHDIVRFARSQGILCQGRGAAANSAVCYCLGVTAVDPDRIDLLFERFISRERNEPPDIDIDFEHERREEVIQYLYHKYGRDRAALTAEVITYRPRSAVREVGKALGLSLDCVDRLAKSIDWFDPEGLRQDRLRVLGMSPNDRTIQLLAMLVSQVLGFPRHLSQHVGGFVLTEQPLSQTVPIENAAMPDRTVIEWDKDDIDALGMLKVDCLGLGMLTCVRKCFDLIEKHQGRKIELHTIPPEDPATYDMICDADTVGVFQIESRAQMSMLPRLRPRCFYDLVIEVAIVRPGPIQGDMVHPYLRRRNGEEPVSFPDDKVRRVLERTLGVPLFQEQAMALSIVAAGFTPDEADQLRRAIAAWKRKTKVMHEFGRRIIEGMLANGYGRAFAERCFEQIKGFSEYGFPESHAASFALIVYASAWLKRHHPAAFTAALLNSQPMGFYAPAQIVRDAKEHGVIVRPVDVNHSRWDCTLETGDDPALRLGMRLVKGLKQQHADRLADAVSHRGTFKTIESLWRCSGVSAASLRQLASADGFGSMGLTRQQALWAVRALHDEPLPLFDCTQHSPEEHEHLPPIAPSRQVIHDYAAIGLSLKAHPVSFMRNGLDRFNAIPNRLLSDMDACPHGKPVTVAGIVLVRQRPGTASGVVFMTIEDETGIANLILWPKVYERYRRDARHSAAVMVRGVVERDSMNGQVVHVTVRSIRDISGWMEPVATRSRDFH